jgi:hypothetical protein
MKRPTEVEVTRKKGGTVFGVRQFLCRFFTIGVISRPGAARPRAELDGVTPIPPFL